MDEHPRSGRRPPPALGVAAELDPPVTRVDVAAFAAKALADEPVERLDRLGLACTRLTLSLQGGRGPADRVVNRAERAPRGSEAAPWPGRIPEPAPAVVHPDPVPAEVHDDRGRLVAVSGRGLLSAEPSRLRVSGGSWARIMAWAGPWPVDERWWDPSARHQLARLQVTSDDGVAYLLKLADGRWWVEATYD